MVNFCFINEEEEEIVKSDQRLVCVKQVKQEAANEWDESMPLPGDIMEGFADNYDAANDDNFEAVKAKTELSSLIAKINPIDQFIWLMI